LRRPGDTDCAPTIRGLGHTAELKIEVSKGVNMARLNEGHRSRQYTLALVVIGCLFLAACGRAGRYELEGIRLGMTIAEVNAKLGQRVEEWQSGTSPSVNLRLLEQGLRIFKATGKRYNDLSIVSKDDKVQQIRARGLRDDWTPAKVEADLRSMYGEPTKSDESSKLWWGSQTIQWKGNGFLRKAKGVVLTVSFLNDPLMFEIELADFGSEWQEVGSTFAL
jgi:hypothetical protein